MTATPHPEAGYISLRFDDASGMTGILRADVNGNRLVRLHSTELPASGVLTVLDWEAALSGPVYYRLYSAIGEVWTSLDAVEPRFILPHRPYVSSVPDMITNYSASRASTATFHKVIDRPDPVVLEGALGLRRGSLEAWFPDYMGARDLEDLLNTGNVVMFRQAEHPGQDMYFRAENTSISPDEDGWKLALDYLESPFPTGYVLPSKSWSFNRLAIDEPNFAAVRDGYASFHALGNAEAL
jgi:hypothetical protein